MRRRIGPKGRGFPSEASLPPGSGVGEGPGGLDIVSAAERKQGHLDLENGEGGLPNEAPRQVIRPRALGQ